MKIIKILFSIFLFSLCFNSLSFEARPGDSRDDLDKIFMKVIRDHAERINNEGLVKAIDEAKTYEEKAHIVDCIEKDPKVVGHASKDILNFYYDLLLYEAKDLELDKINTNSSTTGPGWVVGGGGGDDEHIFRNVLRESAKKGHYANKRRPASINSSSTTGPGWVIGGEDDHIMDVNEVRSIVRSLGI